MKKFIVLVVLMLGIVACQPAEPVQVEVEVTRVVTEIVEETVMVEGTPEVVEVEVTRLRKGTTWQKQKRHPRKARQLRRTSEPQWRN